MKKLKLLYIPILTGVLLAACSDKKKNANYNKSDTLSDESDQKITLAAPYETKSVQNYSTVIGWPKDSMPKAPQGFTVSLYAEGLNNPRNIYVAPNGDVFVSQASTDPNAIKKAAGALNGKNKSQNLGNSANNVLIFRDANGDGTPDLKGVFLSKLNKPYGITIIDNWFYVANTDGVWRYHYYPGDSRITGTGEKILILPAGGYNNHWTRNLRAANDGSKIYIAVGSGSNVGEHSMANEARRANILEISPDGSNERIYASGLRNPAGLDFQPGTNILWTAVNERDGLGDNLVPDYLTSVKEGGFYGWPYAYFGQHEDPRLKGERPDMVKKALVPDVSLGSHTASLGLAFYIGKAFPQKYVNGAFIGQHGSWNSSKLVGYKVVFVPFNNGKPGKPEDFLTGFIADPVKQHVYGRPVGVAVAKDGSLLVADDASNKIWRVSAKK